MGHVRLSEHSIVRVVLLTALVSVGLLMPATVVQAKAGILTASPPSQDLGSVTVNVVAVGYVTLTNNGSSTLTLTNLDVRTPGKNVLFDGIGFTGTCGGAFNLQIVAGGSCTVGVGVYPVATGPGRGDIRWNSTAGNSNWVELTLTGI
jgi:hypothetical protein